MFWVVTMSLTFDLWPQKSNQVVLECRWVFFFCFFLSCEEIVVEILCSQIQIFALSWWVYHDRDVWLLTTNSNHFILEPYRTCVKKKTDPARCYWGIVSIIGQMDNPKPMWGNGTSIYSRSKTHSRAKTKWWGRKNYHWGATNPFCSTVASIFLNGSSDKQDACYNWPVKEVTVAELQTPISTNVIKDSEAETIHH